MSYTKPLIVSIEGNIGTGKSTILYHLEQYYKQTNDTSVIFVKEPVDEWETIKDAEGETILAKFYKDPHKYAFAFQIMAYATRLSILRKAIRENPECKVLVCERSLEADKYIFANMLHDDGHIDDVCYQIYTKNFGEYSQDFGVDRVVYIDSEPEVCYQRISKRSRTGEGGIALGYLEKCKRYHDAWLKGKPGFPPYPLPFGKGEGDGIDEGKGEGRGDGIGEGKGDGIDEGKGDGEGDGEGDGKGDGIDEGKGDDVSNSITQILHLETNQDVKYDMDDETDLGASWIRQIRDFITV